MGLRDVDAPPNFKDATPVLVDAVIEKAGTLTSSSFGDHDFYKEKVISA